MNIYQGGFADRQWVEKSFTENVIDEARIRFRADQNNTGFYWELQEFDFYKVRPLVTLPTVGTSGATKIGQTIATLNGLIWDNGGEDPTRWFEWGTESGVYPNYEDCGVGGKGTYSKKLTGLKPGETYYYRTRASNSGGTDYGGERSFTTPLVLVETESWKSLEVRLNGELVGADAKG